MALEDAISVAAPGVTISVAGASASASIPNTSAGTKPRYIRLSSTTACYARLSAGASTAIPGDMLVHPAESMVVRVGGASTVAAVQVSAAGILQVSPLEDM